ncbi:hypothetical protein LOZ53_003887 [Ophidiomyces ophidiicola]|nr:hypothetical protein LOZ53_003887 [Ophidiomyces ophidiicola]
MGFLLAPRLTRAPLAYSSYLNSGGFRTGSRHASLNSAISRGRRKDPAWAQRGKRGKNKAQPDRKPHGRQNSRIPLMGRTTWSGINERQFEGDNRPSWNNASPQRERWTPRSDASQGNSRSRFGKSEENLSWNKRKCENDDHGFMQGPGWSRQPHVKSKGKRKKKERETDISAPLSLISKVSIVAPQSVPYSSAVSEFIYGYSAVQAAVLSGRRKIYTLYIYDSDVDSPRWTETKVNGLQKFATAAGARVKLVSGTWSNLLNKVCDNRPHNGFVAEVSPLPKLPTLSYQPVSSSTATHFDVNVAPQSREEADVNGRNGRIPLMLLQQHGEHNRERLSRFPLTLLLDGILDPGNLGAIIRSAYFFGVDAIAFSSRNSAPLSAVTIKSSAGATENIPLMSIHDPISFMSSTQQNGWRFFAAEPPAPSSGEMAGYNPIPRSKLLSPHHLSSQLRKSPCVLMLGGEGYGLSKSLKRKADAFVAIPGARTGNISDDPAKVDSLNVSVAAGLLCEAFMRTPPLEQGETSAIKATPNFLESTTTQVPDAEDVRIEPESPEQETVMTESSDRVF